MLATTDAMWIEAYRKIKIKIILNFWENQLQSERVQEEDVKVLRIGLRTKNLWLHEVEVGFRLHVWNVYILCVCNKVRMKWGTEKKWKCGLERRERKECATKRLSFCSL